MISKFQPTTYVSRENKLRVLVIVQISKNKATFMEVNTPSSWCLFKKAERRTHGSKQHLNRDGTRLVKNNRYV